MSREYVSVVGSAKPISPADLQKSAQWPNSLLATFDGTTPGSSLASTFQSNIIFLSGFPDQCLLDTKTFHAWIPHFLPLASAIVAHYSNESIDSALLSSWLQRDRPLIHKYHKGFGLIIQLPRERWFGPDGHLNVHDPAPDGLPMIPIFHVPPSKTYKGHHRSLSARTYSIQALRSSDPHFLSQNTPMGALRMFPCDILHAGAFLSALLNLCAHYLAAHGHPLLWMLLVQVPLGNHHSFEYVGELLIPSDSSAIQHTIRQHLSLVNKIVQLIDISPWRFLIATSIENAFANEAGPLLHLITQHRNAQTITRLPPGFPLPALITALLSDSHPLVLAPVHFLWVHRSLMSTPAGEPLTEGGDSLHLLLAPATDSLPAAFADLHFSSNCYNLLEQYHPIHPPSPIPSWQHFHEIVVRPNRSPHPPSSTTVPPRTSIDARKPSRRQGSSQSVLQPSSAPLRPPQTPTSRSARSTPITPEVHIIRLSPLQPSAPPPPPPLAAIPFASAHFPPLLPSLPSSPEWEILRISDNLRTAVLDHPMISGYTATPSRDMELRCSTLLGSSDRDLLITVFQFTRAQILLLHRIYPNWLPPSLVIPIDFFFTHPLLAPPSFRSHSLPSLPTFPPELIGMCPRFGITNERLATAGLQALKLQYEALTTLIHSHDPSLLSPRFTLSSSPIYYTPHLFRRPDLFSLAGRTLLNPPALTDALTVHLLVLRRALELPLDFSDQMFLNLVNLYINELPLAHSPPFNLSISNFPFLPQLCWDDYTAGIPILKRSSLSAEVRRGLGLLQINVDPVPGLVLRAIIAFDCALDDLWSRGSTPRRSPRGCFRLTHSAPSPATSGYVAMETDLPTNIAVPRLTDLVQDKTFTEKHLVHSIQQVPSLWARLLLTLTQLRDQDIYLPTLFSNYPPICDLLRNSLLAEAHFQELYEAMTAEPADWHSTIYPALENVCPCPDFEPTLAQPQVQEHHLDIISYMALGSRDEELLILSSILLRAPYWIRALQAITSLSPSLDSYPPEGSLPLLRHYLWALGLLSVSQIDAYLLLLWQQTSNWSLLVSSLVIPAPLPAPLITADQLMTGFPVDEYVFLPGIAVDPSGTDQSLASP